MVVLCRKKIDMNMPHKTHIFVADDDSEDRMIVLESLQEFFDANNIHMAKDGTELMPMLDQFYVDTQQALIILDLNMPRMNGIETLKKIKQTPRLAQIPVVILSTSVNERQKEECAMLGASYYFSKPYSYAEVKQIGKRFYDIALSHAG